MAQPVTMQKVQSSDRNMNQLQNNISNTLQVVGIGLSSVTIVGEIKTASLSESEFQAQAGKNWIICDGRSVVGSQYNKITGLLKAPTIAIVGTVNSFLRID